MIKCFLSHSSQDKARYVRQVAAKIRKEIRIIDEETFEEGMTPVEEIAKGLDDSALFVIFISEAALESDWVKGELQSAHNLFTENKLERIYPIIIEEGLEHDDSRIPEWMRNSLNIKPVLKPAIAARKINARLTEISWQYHPKLKERKEIFVGRFSLLQKISERVDDFTLQTPIALVASGLESVGRKSLLENSMRRSNVVRESYEFPVISLTNMDSIEDFVLKTLDLGFFDCERQDFLEIQTIKDKTAFACDMVRQLISEKERIVVEDRGVLVQADGELVDWFSEILAKVSSSSYITFLIASRYRLQPRINRENPIVYSVPVSEMDDSEKNGLLVRYSKFSELSLTQDEFSFFADLLTGYPEQVLYAVDLIKDNGVFGAKKQSHSIQQYASDKAKVVLEQYNGKSEILEFIHLLCRFEFISYEALFDIVPEPKFGPIVKDLLHSSICEHLGSAPDYIRVNEVIRDYVSRSRFGLTTSFDQSVNDHVNKFVANYNEEDTDISDYLFSAQESLKSGKQLPDELIIPSVFLKTIKRLYNEERKYKDAKLLADQVLRREQYLHKNIIDHIRYIKCQCLARLRDKDFFSEVREVPEPNRSFLHGFYYRIAGNTVKAEESLKRVLEKNSRDPRAMGELVLVYMNNDDYDQAYHLAKNNYYNRSSNPINANNYFSCLIMKDKTEENKKELKEIIAKMSIDTSERSREMVASAQARLLAFYENNEAEAMEVIEETIAQFPDIDYPQLTKADLAIYFKNSEKLREAIFYLDENVGKNAQTFRTKIKYKALLLSMDGKINEAEKLIDRELWGLSDKARRRLNERLVSIQ